MGWLEALQEKGRAFVRARSPDVALDGSGVRVERTSDGLVVGVDPASYRRAARRAGALVASFFALFAFVPLWPVRFGALGVAALVLVLAFRAKPPRDRLVVTASRVRSEARHKGAREIAAAEVRAVRLEREEHTTTDSDGNRTTHVAWPVRLDAAEPWFLATSDDRALSRRFAEDVALVLGAPFADATGGTATTVTADDVNLPLMERLRAGVLASDAPGTPAPTAVAVRDVAGGVEFASRPRRWGAAFGAAFAGAWFVGLGGIGAVALVVLGLSLQGLARWGAWAFALFPLVFVAAGVAFASLGVGMVSGERYVRVTRDGVVAGTRRAGRDKVRTLDLSRFEDVRVAKDVSFVGDETEEGLGFEHLLPADREWLAGAIRHALRRYAA